MTQILPTPTPDTCRRCRHRGNQGQGPLHPLQLGCQLQAETPVGPSLKWHGLCKMELAYECKRARFLEVTLKHRGLSRCPVLALRTSPCHGARERGAGAPWAAPGCEGACRGTRALARHGQSRAALGGNGGAGELGRAHKTDLLSPGNTRQPHSTAGAAAPSGALQEPGNQNTTLQPRARGHTVCLRTHWVPRTPEGSHTLQKGEDTPLTEELSEAQRVSDCPRPQSHALCTGPLSTPPSGARGCQAPPHHADACLPQGWALPRRSPRPDLLTIAQGN